jgi:outer membrane protein OmpA-like peptidoglycan-associated protein
MVNQGVSDLDGRKVEFENDVYFDRDSAMLKDAAKPALASLADAAKSLDGYLIESSGYASDVLSPKMDQKPSEERAAAMARNFHEVKDVPMRRILVPVVHKDSILPAQGLLVIRSLRYPDHVSVD